MYEVVLSAEARRKYEAADPPLVRKLHRCFEQLERDPHHHNNIKRLRGSAFAGIWRYRIGEWRVLYRIDDGANRVNISAIAHRSDAYE